MRTILHAICCLLFFTTAAVGATVHQRGTTSPLSGEIILINEAGVTIRSETGVAHFIPWDRVQAVDAEPPDPRLEQLMDVAEDLWRARSRVERGDTVLAELLLARLFERFEGQTHETALVAAEGLLRCQLARGAHTAAVIPALETARLRRADVTTTSYSMLEPVFDEKTSLCPQLAPVWVAEPGLSVLRRRLSQYDPQNDEVISAIATLYQHAVARVFSTQAETIDYQSLPDHPGVLLLADIMRVFDTDDNTRLQGRKRLNRLMEDNPDWMQAWARFFTGVSLLDESGAGRQQRGMVHLLALPAHHTINQPYLAGLALKLVANELQKLGELQKAQSLRGELQVKFSAHPAIRYSAAGIK